jgi:hypothetical protein
VRKDVVLIRLIIVNYNHMEVEKKRKELACAKPRRTSGILTVEKSMKKFDFE